MEALLKAASNLADGSPCHFTGSPIKTEGYTILIIRFPDANKSWAARIPLYQDVPLYTISVQPLEFVARNLPQVFAPRVHGYADVGTGKENSVGVSYMLLDWIDGASLQPWHLYSPSRSAKEKFIGQLVDQMLEMFLGTTVREGIVFYGQSLLPPAGLVSRPNCDIGVPSGTARNTPVTTTVWLTESVDRGLRRSLRQKKTSDAIDYLIQRSMIPRYIASEHENSPWVVVHGDLHNGNIIVDDDLNLCG
jgi:aminoglycoside phosphotransferase (APT) family kinase protein